MFVSNSSALVPDVPTIDLSEAHWAAAELTALIEKLGHDSPVSMVLRQARRELASLATCTGTSVVGPLRVAA
jgi:hypothetical protein